MDVRLLVTGGAGFIGSTFIKLMLTNHPDWKITNLDALTYAGNLLNLKEIEGNKNYKFIHGNICNKDLVENLVKNHDYIVNFAAETHVDRSIEASKDFIQTNINGVHNILENCRKYGIKRFVQISTDEVYGSIEGDGYFYETTPLSPNSPYSASKASADLLTLAYFKTYNMPVLITRCSNNYGPNQYPEKLIPFFIKRILNNQKVPVYGDGLNVRDWLYVDDHCRAIEQVLLHGQIGEVYNIGGHNEKTNLEITKIILKELGQDDSMLEFVKDRLGHDRRYAISNDKISKELNWQPIVDFETGIKSTINWYLNNKEFLERNN